MDARGELARFDPDAPLERAGTPPGSWYRDPAIAALEAQRVFGRSWQYAAPIARLEEAGSWVTFDLGDESWVLARDAEGELRGLANVCRHHAARLVDGEGCARELVCPYHGWTYALDGRLRRAPGAAGLEGLADVRLPSLAVEVFGPLAFLHPGRPARSLAAELGELGARLAATGIAELRHVARRSWELACNWKVFVDNFLDGGYHVAHLHGGLAGRLELGSYATELFETSALQSCRANAADGGAAAAGADFAERLGEGALYAWIHPNLMLNRYGPVLDANRVVPLGPERCRVDFDWWIEAERAGDRSFVERCVAASAAVQEEDVAICESVQRGMRTRSFVRGRYAPRFERALFHFHRRLAADLRAGD